MDMTASVPDMRALIDPRSDRPQYRQLADHLRDAISDLQPGDALPAEPELMDTYQVSRPTVRQAVAVLRSEGLVVTTHGRGTFVRQKRRVRRVASDRYAAEAALLEQEGQHPLETAFTREHGIAWGEFGVEVDAYREVTPPDAVADALGLVVGAEVLERRVVLYAGEVPDQIRTSYYPLDLVAGTPVADPARQPWPGGTMAELASLDVTVAATTERVRSRMPTPEEASVLDIAGSVPVLVVRRVFHDGTGEPVETDEQVMPADRAELEYRVAL